MHTAALLQVRRGHGAISSSKDKQGTAKRAFCKAKAAPAAGPAAKRTASEPAAGVRLSMIPTSRQLPSSCSPAAAWLKLLASCLP